MSTNWIITDVVVVVFISTFCDVNVSAFSQFHFPGKVSHITKYKLCSCNAKSMGNTQYPLILHFNYM